MKPSNDREAITLILQALVDGGNRITEVADDTWNLDDRTKTDDVEKAVELVTGVDEAYVFLTTPFEQDAWVRFVLGNEPEEVACDHTTNISDWIDPVVRPWWV